MLLESDGIMKLPPVAGIYTSSAAWLDRYITGLYHYNNTSYIYNASHAKPST
jgi:hypothetical protein